MAGRRHEPDADTRLAVCAAWPVLAAGVCALLSRLIAASLFKLEAPGEVAAHAASERPHVALLIEVPGGDETSFATLVTAWARVAPVIVFGALPDRAAVTRMLDAGARGCVAGTSAVADLLEAIARARAGKGYLCPTAAHRFVGPGKSAAGPARPRLTERETEVLRLLGRGHTSGQIAARFGLSVRTIHTHRARILRKLGVRTTAALVRAALRAGLLDPRDGTVR
ncbi:MAG: response regulator transcription factor [bacterium]|nr:response regulator transcription factor [bacterium]